MIEVARIYRFRARHSLPDMPEPWCFPHEHDYTVEVVARGEGSVVVDTDVLDYLWGGWRNNTRGDLNESFPSTTVEALASSLLQDLRMREPTVHQVTVREDDQRWGRATA